MPDVRIRTPLRITPEIKKLCSKICGTRQPVYVPVKPEAGGEYNECFRNVKSKVERDGGNIQFGWAIWEWPRVFLEAECHAVWESPGGELIDISPRSDAERKVLFLADTKHEFDFADGSQRVENIRLPLVDDPKVHEYIRLSQELFALAAGNETTIPRREALPLLKRLSQLEKQLLSRAVGRNDPCPCGSGEKYKRCCLRNVSTDEPSAR